MERSQILVFGALIVCLLVGGVIYSVSGALQAPQASDAEIVNEVEKVDEALLRVPIPPSPKELEEPTLSEEMAREGEEATVPDAEEAVYRRDLPGTHAVTSSITDPRTECPTSGRERFNCYSDFITSKTTHEGIEEAFVDLKERYNAGDQYIISQCHQFTHVIGRAATQLFPTVAEAYNYGDTFCWSGYFHGIMEAIIAEMGIEQIPHRLNDICATIPGKESYSFNYYNCVHGLGHGVMYVESHELFKALELCNNLEGSWERSSCYGGVFMENVIANEVDHVSDYLKKDDLIYPCNAVDEQYKHQCYLMQTSYALKELKYDFAAVFDLCAEKADTNYENICYQSLGRDASGSSSSNADRTRATCLLGPTENAQKNCIVGAVKDFISYHHSDTQAQSLCASLPENLQTSCFDTAESYYQSFPK